jgi:uncharacterized protein YndB with AHSA1/START domain
VITRVVNAPQALVYQAWTTRAHVEHWWRPEGFASIVCDEFDARAGGRFGFTLKATDGNEYVSRCVFRELAAPERLSYDEECFENGKLFHRAHQLVTFEAVGARTLITLNGRLDWVEGRDARWTPAVMRAGWSKGWNENLDALEGYLDRATAHVFELVRRFDAPRSLLWKLWTEPEHLRHWWGPKGASMRELNLDVRVGGALHCLVRLADGSEVWSKWVYLELVEPERIVFQNSRSDAQGNVTPHPRVADWPLEMITAFEFAESAGKTTVTMRSTALCATDAQKQAFEAGHAGIRIGWTETFDRLDGEALTAGVAPPCAADEFVIARMLDAPRELVWKAWTEAGHFGQWWGPKVFTNPVCSIDLRVAGAYRVVMRSPDGVDYPIKGVFREIKPHERLVMTMDCSEHPPAWHDMLKPDRAPGDTNPVGTILCAVTFEEHAGKTLLTIRLKIVSAEMRDRMVSFGTHEGWSESLEKLAEWLEARR